MQLILEQSTEVVRKAPGVLITRNRLGLVCANAGIDQSNLDHGRSATAHAIGSRSGVRHSSIRNLTNAITDHLAKCFSIREAGAFATAVCRVLEHIGGKREHTRLQRVSDLP